MDKVYKQIQEYERINHQSFSGIFITDREYEDEKIKELVERLCKNFNKVGVVDSKMRNIESNSNYIIAPSSYAGIADMLIFSNGKYVTMKGNLLMTRPDYIIFREYISEENIEEVIKVISCGEHVVAFMNFEKQKIEILIQKKLGLSDKGAKRFMRSITICGVRNKN
ncbi:hypothetical protein [Alkaliphilus sp. B6464]|uniref:hypothetical protein n=1 Tax=Alkaliphilus sp. B6464 TaxID=2731219 RepID=UPI001BA8F168|nr:hypothetical protein [Alkaliphilus sp. B6464]QUH21774.1 hypothetical protein HYG84_17715 [Alkaliphilus sp. B6464]